MPPAPQNQSNNDQPTVLDKHLGYDHFVTKLAQEIKISTPPKTFAITGYWGAGKTSALAMLYKELTGNSPGVFEKTKRPSKKSADYEGVWFEAWKYQNEASPIVALLHTLKKHFSVTQKIIDSAGKLASVSVLGALSVFDGAIKSVTGMSGVSKIKEIGEKYENENLLAELPTDKLNEALSDAIEALIGEDKILVIFIDDLDRCEPEAALSLLEGLKLYLNLPNCIVVMAIDTQQIELKISSKYKDLGVNYSHFHGVEYMEKLCQDAHRLPVPDKETRNKFLLSCVETAMASLQDPQNSILTSLKNVLQQYDCLPANPRRLKMLANRLVSVFKFTNAQRLSASLQAPFAQGGVSAGKNPVLQDFPLDLYCVACVVVASFYVNYRKLYERIEKDAKFINELIKFVDEPKNHTFDEPSSVFFEFERTANNNVEALVEHPSDLSYFRLKCFFKTGQSPYYEEYGLQPLHLGLILHHLIKIYNSPS